MGNKRNKRPKKPEENKMYSKRRWRLEVAATEQMRRLTGHFLPAGVQHAFQVAAQATLGTKLAGRSWTRLSGTDPTSAAAATNTPLNEPIGDGAIIRLLRAAAAAEPTKVSPDDLCLVCQKVPVQLPDCGTCQHCEDMCTCRCDQAGERCTCGDGISPIVACLRGVGAPKAHKEIGWGSFAGLFRARPSVAE